MNAVELLQAMNELEARSPELTGVELRLSPDGSGCIRGTRRPSVAAPWKQFVMAALTPETYEVEFEFESLNELATIL
jgi:hypothetical protein